MSGVSKHPALRCREGVCEPAEELVAVEARLRISINGTHLMSLYCTPLLVRELVVGLLMTEGVAEGICTDRMSIVYDGEEVAVDVPAEGKVNMEGATVTSGCVGGITFSRKLGTPETSAASDDFSITPAELHELFRHFQKRSDMYNQTGCIHSAALADRQEVICFAEDIGRHNAVDKVIGMSILEGFDFRGKLMMASGRLSSEIVSKCARWGIPMVVSRTAPTARSLKIAEESGVTVVGFLRGERFNVYTHVGRIKI